ncbi:MAG: peptidyl-prolyl cis-trans isomerase C [Gallionellaceae bacterium]|nr:MAG: peptidyl-prolyl cis-trans isomerase C [Gallionellaceae bacterium]
MKRNLIGLFILLGLFQARVACAEEAVLKVNGVAIPQVRIDMRAKASGHADTAELRKIVRDEMIILEVIAQEAVRLGLNKNSEAAQQIELAKMSVLSSLFVQDYVKNHPVTDSQIKQEYERVKPSYSGTEYNVRHILLATEKEAKEVLALLAKGGSFEKLATEKSKDANSAARGGSLGWALPSVFVPQIASALLILEKGGYTQEPVQSQMGWHVIRLDDVRERKAPSLEELKPQIQQRLQQLSLHKAMGDLRAKAKIE